MSKDVVAITAVDQAGTSYMAGVFNVHSNRITFKSFPITPASNQAASSVKRNNLPEDVKPLVEFIQQHTSREQPRVIIELPAYLFDMQSNTQFKLLSSLIASGFGNCGMAMNQQMQKMGIHYLMPTNEIPTGMSKSAYEAMLKTQMWFLPSQMTVLYAQLILETREPTIEQRTAIALHIGNNPTLYHFLMVMAGTGIPSSGDLISWINMWQVEFLKDMTQGVMHQGRSGRSLMVNCSRTSKLKVDDLEKIAMEYAIAAKKAEVMGKPLDQKLGFLAACQQWGVRCYFSFGVEDSPMMLPQQSGQTIVLDPEKPLPNALYTAYYGVTPPSSQLSASAPTSAPGGVQKDLIGRLRSVFSRK